MADWSEDAGSVDEVARRRRRRIALGGVAIGGVLVLLAAGAAVVAALVWLDDGYLHEEWAEQNPLAGTTREGDLPLLEPHDCPFSAGEVDASCATLVVPLDRDDPAAGIVELAVAVLSSGEADRGATPALYLEGGPGGYAVADAWWWPDTFPELLASRDLILMDQRGTGFSSPTLVCPELLDVEEDEDDPISGEVMGLEACHERLVDDGVDLASFSTKEAAADIADLRTVLGVPELHLLGVSYGTRVALAVLRDHPDVAASAVLDSVFPADIASLDDFADNAAQAFSSTFAACAADSACAARFGDLTSLFAEAVDDLNRSPVDVRLGLTGTETITGDELVQRLFGALYHPASIAGVPHFVADAAAGDVAAALEALEPEAYDPPPLQRLPRGTFWADEDSDGVFYSATCREELPLSSEEVAFDRAAAVDPTYASALSSTLESTYRVCAFWDAGVAQDSELAPAVSDAPTLLLTGTLDPITPPRWAYQAAATLTSAHVQEIEGLGHAVMSAGPCADALITGFFNDPSADPEDLCGPLFASPPFDVD